VSLEQGRSYFFRPHCSTIACSHFGIDIEACARCGGKLAIVASIEEPEVIAKILAHLQHIAPEQYQPELPLKVAGAAAASQPDLTQRGGDSAGRGHGGKGRCAPAPDLVRKRAIWRGEPAAGRDGFRRSGPPLCCNRPAVGTLGLDI
jgi:hypothetical protein